MLDPNTMVVRKTERSMILQLRVIIWYTTVVRYSHCPCDLMPGSVPGWIDD